MCNEYKISGWLGVHCVMTTAGREEIGVERYYQSVDSV